MLPVHLQPLSPRFRATQSAATLKRVLIHQLPSGSTAQFRATQSAATLKHRLPRDGKTIEGPTIPRYSERGHIEASEDTGWKPVPPTTEAARRAERLAPACRRPRAIPPLRSG